MSISQFAQDFLNDKPNSYVSKYRPRKVTLDSCELVGAETFEKTFFREGYDALLLVYSSHNSKESEKISVVFNRVCRRFAELGYSQLRVYAFDSALHRAHKSINLSKIPKMFLAPAEHKEKRYVEYSGVNDAHDIMKFVEKNADAKFKLPELPHLSAEEVEEYNKLKATQAGDDSLINNDL